ncbi:MAG: M20/M25/M40 family metallo-hydrolase [Thermodesulfobacteriota bacterium]
MINERRMADVFTALVEIDSVSRQEGRVAARIRQLAENLGARVLTDASAANTGSDTGNLVLKFTGNRDVEPMLLSAHMDTVEPGKGIRPRFQNGVFTSSGDTILGADDKSAIAIIVEALQILKEKNLPHGPIEVVLTTCEEIGLQGAKHLDFNLLGARFGYVLDTTDTEAIVTRAPAANKMTFRIHGKDAHAGVAPEKGINAISLAARAIASLDLGRIDPETTCNIGTIEGGVATNIIPSLVTMHGEVRSHDESKLERLTRRIVAAFQQAVEGYEPADASAGRARLESEVETDFFATHIPEDHRVVVLARRAAAALDRKLALRTTGGGSDANIFFKQGIITGVLGTGMQDMHTVRESIRIDHMTRTAELLLGIIQLHAENGSV